MRVGEATERIGYEDMIKEWRCGEGRKREKIKGSTEEEQAGEGRKKARNAERKRERRKEKERWQCGCVGRMGVGAYRRLLLPETWPPEPAWALDAHVEQFTVMEL